MRRISSLVAGLIMVAGGALQASAQGSEPKPPAPPDAPVPAKPPVVKKEDAEALKALRAGIEKTQGRKHVFTTAFDVEAGGSPMMSMEVKGEHSKPWTHFSGEMMGRKFEGYTNGEENFTLKEDGTWARGGGQIRGGFGLDQVGKALKSATFAGEAKVAGHDCLVIKAKADMDAIRKAIGGRGAQQGEVKGSSLRFYIDKKDGRLRTMKLKMTAETQMGGNAMEIDIIIHQHFRFLKKMTFELPAELKKLVETPKPPPDPEHHHDNDEKK